MFCTHSRDCVTYNMSCDYIPRKQARNLHESDTLILYFTLVPGDETTSICFEAPTDRPCHLAKHTPAKQLAHNFSDGKTSFTPQSPLDWCEDPKPSWAIALRPQRRMQRHRTAAYGTAFAWKPFCFTPRAGVCWILRSSHQNLPGILAQPEFCQSMSKFLGLKQLDFIWKMEWIWVKTKTKRSKLQKWQITIFFSMLIYASAHRHVFLRQFWWKIMKTAMNGMCQT